jgi:hypothetical protein
MAFYGAMAVLLGASVAFGQMNTGEIAGIVQDQLGGRLPHATIIAEQFTTGQKFNTSSNDVGAYLFPTLPVGVYSVKASARNFKQALLPAFEVHVGERLRYDFTLQLGDASDTVTVVVDAAGAQLESAEIKDIVQGRQVVGLPLEGRQFLDLAMLSPGVVRPPGGADGILDRLVHNAHRIEMRGDSMCKNRGKPNS